MPRLRLTTVAQLFRHFWRRGNRFLAPLLVVLLLGGILLALTGGLSYVAPFVYALF